MLPFLKCQPNTGRLPRTVHRPPRGAVRVEHDRGVHQRQTQPAAFEGERTSGGSPRPGCEAVEQFFGSHQKLQLVADRTCTHITGGTPQFSRCGADDTDERAAEGFAVGGFHQDVFRHLRRVHGDGPGVIGRRDAFDQDVRGNLLPIRTAILVVPPRERRRLVAEIAETGQCFLQLFERTFAVGLLRQPLVEQEPHVAVGDANRSTQLMREDMKDVVDPNAHANRERTTWPQRRRAPALTAEFFRGGTVIDCSENDAARRGRGPEIVPPKRILLVDDYPDALEIWGLYLRSVGYDVVTAADGLTAVARAHEAHPDVIVLDLELPGITGFEAAVRLRTARDTQHIPMIAATGYSHASQLNQARQSGFDSIMVKPCDPAALVAEIERLLAAAGGSRSPEATTTVERTHQKR